jgi:hypothetical protein
MKPEFKLPGSKRLKLRCAVPLSNVFIRFNFRRYSKGDASKWHLYIQQLPRRYNLLAVWTTAERAELQAPFAVAAAERCADEAGGLLTVCS